MKVWMYLKRHIVIIVLNDVTVSQIVWKKIESISWVGKYSSIIEKKKGGFCCPNDAFLLGYVWFPENLRENVRERK